MMLMKIYLRCDSSQQIGTGHVFRCLALAELLRKEGHQLAFICRELEGNIINFIREKQFKVLLLPSPKTQVKITENPHSWLGASIRDEVLAMREVIEKDPPHWIISDHYSLDILWEKEISSMGVRILAVDDINRIHQCDVLLDQNYYTSASDQYSSSLVAKKFIGQEYALLSRPFMELKEKVTIRETIQRILVSFGGVDLGGESLRFLDVIKARPEIHFDVVTGLANPRLNELKTGSLDLRNMTLHIQTPKMAALMIQSDLFIGASGTTTWERCFLGLPGICITVADNQLAIAENLSAKGVHTYLGQANKISSDAYLEAIRDLEDSSKRRVYANSSLDLKVASKMDQILRVFS